MVTEAMSPSYPTGVAKPRLIAVPATPAGAVKLGPPPSNWTSMVCVSDARHRVAIGIGQRDAERENLIVRYDGGRVSEVLDPEAPAVVKSHDNPVKISTRVDCGPFYPITADIAECERASLVRNIRRRGLRASGPVCRPGNGGASHCLDKGHRKQAVKEWTGGVACPNMKPSLSFRRLFWMPNPPSDTLNLSLVSFGLANDVAAVPVNVRPSKVAPPTVTVS